MVPLSVDFGDGWVVPGMDGAFQPLVRLADIAIASRTPDVVRGPHIARPRLSDGSLRLADFCPRDQVRAGPGDLAGAHDLLDNIGVPATGGRRLVGQRLNSLRRPDGQRGDELDLVPEYCLRGEADRTAELGAEGLADLV